MRDGIEGFAEVKDAHVNGYSSKLIEGVGQVVDGEDELSFAGVISTEAVLVG